MLHSGGVIAICLCASTHAAVINFAAAGAVADNSDLATCDSNTALLNAVLGKLQPGDVFVVPNTTFWLQGGVWASGLTNVTLQLDGTLAFSNNQTAWPRNADRSVQECIYLHNLTGVTFTSSGLGTLFGNGREWWGAVKYLLIGENRPRLLHVDTARNVLVEHWLFKDSPYWTTLFNDVQNLEIAHSIVDARFENSDYHNFQELQAFNTDGFDVSGQNIHIHDCTIWNDDDCIAVKETSDGSCSENMLFERINASGVGLTIGSIGVSAGHTCVRNITFRDSTMINSFKGIYIKSRPGNPGETGEITNILYQNITIVRPTQWAIWIGPQQAGYSDACSLLWPEDPLAKCFVPPEMTFTNITLRDIYIQEPKMSPGVILGNTTNPMMGIVFDNVVVTNPGLKPWGSQFYKCDGVFNGLSLNGTTPVPPCFHKQ